MSEFTCSTPTCAISLSKAAFPVQMNCPVCQQALSEVIEKSLLSDEDELLISNLPYVIAYPLKRALTEKHPWTKINLLKDTFLNYLKYLGLITASEFFNSDLKDKKMVTLFHATLAEPSFGTWNLYIRETIAFLNQNSHRFFCPELPRYFEAIETGKKRKLYKGEIEFIDSNGDVQLKKQEATAIGMLINFRNRYLGHGLTLDEDASKKLWDEYYPMFNQLLTQLNFPIEYPMFKHEHGETYLLQSNELSVIEKGNQISASVWMENPSGQAMDILPFFIVPGELALTKEDKEQLLTYESYTGKTIKFFSPEGTEKQTSGKILEKLNLLLRDKQKEQPYTPESFTKEVFLQRIADENKLTLDTLIAEKKYIPGVYVHREEMEIKLREWIGARANIFFIAAEAGSGKTNVLLEMQQQYVAQNLPVIFIRAARMDKPSLQAQIAHLLNIQQELDIEHYTSISGTQASPTFILIDGINEALHGESLWQEILEISKKSTPGSLKFVVSSRANTSAELNRYPLVDIDEVYLYGEKKESHTGLSAYAFWLTALNMSEMKSAWEAYGQTNKNKYKPQFSFDDIAAFDRGIYSLISNPLVLRIFLETYHNKPLPQKGNKHLNIWQDWLTTFSEAEITFLEHLADVIWEKGENELLLDDLLNNPKLNSFLTTDLINAPYPRLKNMGWISRYVKDFNACLSFTVEGALLYLLGNKIEKLDPPIQLSEIKFLLKTGSKLQKDGVGNYLQQQALRGDLKRVCELIDSGDDFVDTCLIPLTNHLKAIGVKETLCILLKEPTDNDWRVIQKLVEKLEELQLFELKEAFLETSLALNEFSTTESIVIALKSIVLLDKEEANHYLNRIETSNILFFQNPILYYEFAKYESHVGNYDSASNYLEKSLVVQFEYLHKEPGVYRIYNEIGIIMSQKGFQDRALEYLEKSLEIQLNTLKNNQYSISLTFNNIGLIWQRKRNYDKAKEIFEESLERAKKNLGGEHSAIATIFNNLGMTMSIKGNFEKAYEYYENCLKIQKKTLGEHHLEVARTYNNIGAFYYQKQDYIQSLNYYSKCLDIRLKKYGAYHPDVARSYINIGLNYEKEDDKDKALKNYKISLDILLKISGAPKLDIARVYLNIASIHYDNSDFYNSLLCYRKSLDFKLKIIDWKHKSLANLYRKIALCHENQNNLLEALNNFVIYSEIRRDDPDFGLKASSTQEAIAAAKRLAVELGKEDELPEWIQEIQL